MDNEKKIEIPFGAFDSELEHQEINIPNGFKAVIDGNKIILTRAESEDEKVRKALAEMVHDTTGDELWVDYNVHKEEAIAWLEKQKEFVSIDFDDVWEWADCEELTALLEKYSKDAIKEMCHAWYDKGIELERKNWIKKQGEQKPTWSEEDRTMAFTLMRDIDQMSYISEEGKNERIGWLNSLDEKFTSTESAWSEVDEERLSDAIFFVREYQIPTRDKRLLNAAKEAEDWLKALKQRIGG